MPIVRGNARHAVDRTEQSRRMGATGPVPSSLASGADGQQPWMWCHAPHHILELLTVLGQPLRNIVRLGSTSGTEFRQSGNVQLPLRRDRFGHHGQVREGDAAGTILASARRVVGQTDS